MAYSIISQPQPLSLSGNMPDIVLSSNDQVSFKLLLGANIILDEVYYPDSSAQIKIRIKDVLDQHLDLVIPSTNIVEQTNAVKSFTVSIDGNTYTYTVIKGGVDADSADAISFCAQNWLTWQPQSKEVKYNDPSWLSYYATQTTTVKAKGYKADGTSQEIVLSTLTAGKMYTLNVQYAHLLGLFSNAPSYVDLWTEDASSVRLSYIQRLILNNDYDEFDDLFIFENSLGGLDTIRMTGSLQTVNESTSLSALFNEDTLEYDADINKYFNKNTGYYPSESYREWIDEFFTSTNRYHLRKGSIKRIVVKKSEVKSSAGDLNSASFSFAYTKQTKRLNLQRTESLPEVLEFVNPKTTTLFFLAPRLSEFKQHEPEDSSILPIQSPYLAEWQRMTLFDLLTYISCKFGISAGGGGGHVHPDVAMLNKLRVLEQYLLFAGEKIRAGYADNTGECENAKKWDNHVFGDYLDQGVRKQDEVTYKAVVSDDWEDKSEFGGNGFGLLPGGIGKLNHLTVRKNMTIFELLVKKLQSVGGMLVISLGSGKVKSVEELTDRYRVLLEDADGETSITFATDDLIRCQNFGSKTTKYYWRRCLEKGTNYIDLSKDDCDSGSGVPVTGDELVQIGNKSNAARQNVIIIDATDKPKISFYKGVNSYSLAGKERTRLGDLSELGIPDMGIATEAGRFSGEVVIGAKSTGLENLMEWANKQSQIDTAASTAAAASATAAAAKSNAEAATAAIADMASDGKLSPVEKQSYKVMFDGYTSEKAKYDAQADQFAVNRVSYDAAYDSLNAYLTPLFASLTSTSDIVSNTFTSKLKGYTDARTDLANTIAAKTKTAADAAQSTASSAASTASAANSAASSAVGAATEAKEKVDNLKVGGVNLFMHTSLLDETKWVRGGAVFNGDETVTLNSSSNSSYIQNDNYRVSGIAGQTYTISFKTRTSITSGKGLSLYVFYDGGFQQVIAESIINNSTDFKVFSYTFTPSSSRVIGVAVQMNGSSTNSGYAIIKHIKLEVGTIATDWSLNPKDIEADAQAKADAAKAAAIAAAAADAQSKIENLQIGGPNLFPYSDFENGAHVSIDSNCVIEPSPFDGGLLNAKNGTKVLYLNRYAEDSYWIFNAIPVEPNTTYTMSYWYISAGALNAHSSYSYLEDANHTNVGFIGSGQNPVQTNKLWVFHKFTFTTPSNAKYFYFRFGFHSSSYSWSALDCLKLEIGNYATAWCSRIADIVEDYTAKLTALSYLKTALQNDTSINGGLVSTTIVKVGAQSINGTWVEKCGINGAGTGDSTVRLWAGGTLQEAVSVASGGSNSHMTVITEGGKLFAVNAEISGKINADAGVIGGFKINAGSMESNGSWNGGRFVLYPNNGYIAFLNNNIGVWAGIGANVFPASTGTRAVARFENCEENSWGSNIGLFVRCEKAQQNFAIKAIGSVLSDGLMTSYNLVEFRTSSANNVLPIKQGTNILVVTYGYQTVYLPPRDEVAAALGISSSSTFCVRLLVNSYFNNNACNFFIYPPSGCSMYHWDGGTWDRVEMGKGDTIEFLLLGMSFGYYAQVINKQS